MSGSCGAEIEAEVLLPETGLNTVAVSGHEAHLVVVGAYQGGDLWASRDGGRNFVPIPSFLGSISIQQLAFDPDVSERLFHYDL